MSAAHQTLPAVTRMVTARDIVMGAAASRDWQPQHHDADHARAMNLPGIIMNTPTQTGWFHGYLLQWAGPGAWIGRWKLSMMRPICPGMEVTLNGAVTASQPAVCGGEWLWLDLSITRQGGLASTMKIVLLMHEDHNGESKVRQAIDEVCPPLHAIKNTAGAVNGGVTSTE